MAEFCLDCWNRMNKTHCGERDYILSRGLDLCEGCGQWKRVIVIRRRIPALYDVRQRLKRMGKR